MTPKVKEAVYDGMVKLGYTPPTTAGFDTMACIEAAHEGKFSFGLSLGGNLHGSSPDPVFASEAMRKMDTTEGAAKYYPGGRLKFDEKGRRVGAETVILQWRNGTPVPVYPPSLAVMAPLWPKR